MISEKYMQTFVVLPCLNEEGNVGAAVRSLGFEGASHPPEARLVLVDNGSDDGTLRVMKAIAAGAPTGTIEIVRVPERGYVAARGAGVEAAAVMASKMGVPYERVLIVQADADTDYSKLYIEALALEFRHSGPGCLLEGRNERSMDPINTCSAFDDLALDVDGEAAILFSDPAFDVVIDDKVAAFSLTDYRAWGGHVREETASGHEIHAETTRLFIKGRLAGARRRTVDGASAVTSRRRVLAEPALTFATAGFPRDDGWRAQWTASYDGPHELAAFDLRMRGSVDRAIRTRIVHLVAMFGVLPAAIAFLLGATTDERYRALIDELRLPVREEALRRPGLILDHALSVTDRQVDSLFRASGSPPPWRSPV